MRAARALPRIERVAHRLAVVLVLGCIIGTVVFLALRRGEDRGPGLAAPDPARETATSTDELATVAGASHREVAAVTASDVASPGSEVGHVGTVIVRILGAEERAPIAGALVELQRNVMFDRAALHATTIADGTARFEGVEARAWIVSVSAVSWMDARSTASVRSDVPVTDVTLELEARHELVVRLVDAADRPFVPARSGLEAAAGSHLMLVLTAMCGSPGLVTESPSSRIFRTTTLETLDGSLAWRAVVEGGQPACVQAVLGSVIVGAQFLDPDASEVRLVIDAESVRLATSPLVVRVLVGATDEPLVGARVEAHQLGPRSLALSTDEAGFARFSEDVFGDATLVVEAAGFATLSIPVQQPFVDEHVVRMVPGHRVSGRTLDQNGDPMPRARVVLYAGSSADAAPPRFMDASSSGAHAEFAFDGLAPGVYSLAVPAGAEWRPAPNGLVRAPDAPGQGAIIVDVRFGDANEVVLRGRRNVQSLDGEPWNPEQPPRR